MDCSRCSLNVLGGVFCSQDGMPAAGEFVDVEPELRGEAFDRDGDVDHKRAGQLMSEIQDLLAQLKMKLVVLREVSSFDRGRGQSFAVVVKVPRKTDPVTKQKISRTRTEPKKGSNIRVPLANVGQPPTEIDIHFVVPEVTNESGQPGHMRAGGRLRPTFYPLFDTYISKVLTEIAKVLTSDELSHLKAPSFLVTAGAAKGIVPRTALDLDALSEGHTFPRNPRRPLNIQSGAGELLRMAERIADPNLGAFCLQPVAHHGLGFAMQRKLNEVDMPVVGEERPSVHEGAERAKRQRGTSSSTSSPAAAAAPPESEGLWHEGWIARPDDGYPMPAPQVSAYHTGKGKFTDGNTWTEGFGRVDRVLRANRVIAMLRQLVQRIAYLVPESDHSQLHAAATSHCDMTALQWALRILRNDTSVRKLRAFISEQKTEALNHLCGVRIFPTERQVIKIRDEIFGDIAEKAGVQSLTTSIGEVGWWPLARIIMYVLNDPDLKQCFKFPALKNGVCVRLTARQFDAALPEPVFRVTGEGSQLLQNMISQSTQPMFSPAQEADIEALCIEDADMYGAPVAVDEPALAGVDAVGEAAQKERDEPTSYLIPSPSEQIQQSMAKSGRVAVPEATSLLRYLRYMHPDGIPIEEALETGKVSVECTPEPAMQLEYQKDGPPPGLCQFECLKDVKDVARFVTVHGASRSDFDGPGEPCPGPRANPGELDFREVVEMTIRGMIDAGARMGKLGQTIEGITFKAGNGILENLTCNFFVTLDYSGSDTHENYHVAARQGLAEKRWLQKKTFEHGGVIFNITLEHGADGACRRELQGRISVAGQFKNENCDMAKALMRTFCAERPCVDREPKDVLVNADAFDGEPTYRIGSITMGIIVQLTMVLRVAGRTVWKQVNMDEVMTVFSRGEKTYEDFTLDEVDGRVELNVSDGQSWAAQSHDRSPYMLSKAEQLVEIVKWSRTYGGTVARVKSISKLKGALRELDAKMKSSEEKLSAADMLKTATKKINLVDQDLRLVGMVRTLQKLVDDIEHCFVVLQQQQDRALRKDVWLSSLREALAPVDGEKNICALFLAEPESDCEPEARQVQALAKQTLQQVKARQQATGQERPAYQSSLIKELRGLCRSTRAEPSDLPLWDLCGGGKIEDKLKKWTKGMNGSLTFDSPMMLGILHLFCIRGWATLLSNIGVLAWALHVGREFAKLLTARGIPCLYFEKYGVYHFGGIKSKGHDSLKIMMQPEKFLTVLPDPYRRLVQTIISQWSGVWFIVSNPWLAETFFPELDEADEADEADKAARPAHQPPAVSKEVREKKRKRAEDLVVRMCAALKDLLHVVFGGGSIHTPSVHSIYDDIPHLFAILHLDLFFGNEQSIEAAMQVCREILRTLQSSKQMNSDMIKHFIARMEAARRLKPAVKRQQEATARQLELWSGKRWACVQTAISDLEAYDKLESRETHQARQAAAEREEGFFIEESEVALRAVANDGSECGPHSSRGWRGVRSLCELLTSGAGLEIKKVVAGVDQSADGIKPLSESAAQKLASDKPAPKTKAPPKQQPAAKRAKPAAASRKTGAAQVKEAAQASVAAAEAEAASRGKVEREVEAAEALDVVIGDAGAGVDAGMDASGEGVGMTEADVNEAIAEIDVGLGGVADDGEEEREEEGDEEEPDVQGEEPEHRAPYEPEAAHNVVGFLHSRSLLGQQAALAAQFHGLAQHTQWRLGDEVCVLQPGRAASIDGTIAQVNADGTYDVKFQIGSFDGGKARNILPARVRQRETGRRYRDPTGRDASQLLDDKAAGERFDIRLLEALQSAGTATRVTFGKIVQEQEGTYAVEPLHLVHHDKAETLFRPVPSFNGRLDRPLEFVRHDDIVVGFNCPEEKFTMKKFSCNAWRIAMVDQVAAVSSAQQPVRGAS